jgi:hypothetical protein
VRSEVIPGGLGDFVRGPQMADELVDWQEV